MAQFKKKNTAKSAVHAIRHPIPDIVAFDTVVRSLILKNPLGCTSYMSEKKTHLPLETVREMFTAKFVYENAKGKRIGSGSEIYNTVDGYHTGLAAVISNMANIASQCGKVHHVPAADLFSVILKCHDPKGEL